MYHIHFFFWMHWHYTTYHYSNADGGQGVYQQNRSDMLTWFDEGRKPFRRLLKLCGDEAMSGPIHFLQSTIALVVWGTCRQVNFVPKEHYYVSP